jgi:hypothetical protein
MDEGRVDRRGIVVLPHGDNLLGSSKPVDPCTFAKNLTHGLKVALWWWWRNHPVRVRIPGVRATNERGFLAGLPKIMKVHVADEPSGEWLANSIRFSVGEVNGSNAGSGLVLAKLSEVLFVETLRRYINTLPSDQIGWLAGARDPIIGQALALLHKEPADPWTLANLARRVGLSRTAAC